MPPPPDRVVLERDLYRRLLEMTRHDEPDGLLADALALVVDMTGAARGYLEVSGENGTPSWWTAVGLDGDEVSGARRRISRTIIAKAIASGDVIQLPSALLDDDFGAMESVQACSIGAVCCAPVGDPPIGVLYLQHDVAGRAFDDDTQALARLVCTHLGPALDRVIARREATQAADHTAAVRERLRLDGVIGRSESLAKVLRQAELAAPLDVTILLTGESGTGKTQLARAIHANGPRAAGPFIELNCAALPEGLIESELFGALPGAHATAHRRLSGKVEAAEGGTLFLDEISDLSLAAQAKVLQLLHGHEYFALGATKATRANIRLMAASNVDLAAAAAAHRFREDLLFRLTVLTLRLPSLRERPDDLPLLARHFAARASATHGLPSLGFTSGAMATITTTDWPGNVRQLANVVEAAVIRAAGSGAAAIERRHLVPDDPDGSDASPTFQEATRRFQMRLLADMLTEHDWNVSEVARRLDLSRAHVYNLIHAFGLHRTP